MVRPFSLGLRLFVAMIAGHILMEVFGSFIVSGFNGGPLGWGVGGLSFLFIIGRDRARAAGRAPSRPMSSRC